MYTNYKLKENPSFKMTREEFNTLVNDIHKEGKTKVKVALLLRSTYSNMVAVNNDSLLFVTDILPLYKGYFNVVSACQTIITGEFKVSDLDTIKRTVLMPVGAFEDEDVMYIYLNLVVEDEFIERFKTNDSINFLPIEEISLNNLDNKSIMILPTLTVVNK